MPPVLMHTGWQMLLLDVRVLTLLMQRLEFLLSYFKHQAQKYLQIPKSSSELQCLSPNRDTLGGLW